MAGITRFEITDTMNGRGAYRFTDSKNCWPAANALYHKIFNDIGLPLEAGDDVVRCTKAEFAAGYDYALGIDVVLKTAAGQTMTMQEKFLFTRFDTVTVEYMQDWQRNIPGDWFNIKAQFYFVGYDYLKAGKFNKWVLLDWLKVQIATGNNRILWWTKKNNFDGARASFRYVPFTLLPDEVIVAKGY